GHTCENNLMPALMQPTIPALPPSLRIKRFLPFPLDTASAVRLLPGFSAKLLPESWSSDPYGAAAQLTQTTVGTISEVRFGGHLFRLVGGGPAVQSYEWDLEDRELNPAGNYAPVDGRTGSQWEPMDPVQQAVLHHTLGLQPTAKRKHASCSVCQMRFNSQSQALAHLKGTKHAKKLKALDAPKTKPKGPGVTKDSAHPEITKGGAGSRVPNCSEGTAACSETSRGEAEEERPPELPLEPDQVTEPEAQTAAADPETEEEKARRLLYCSLCKVAVNSASQLEAHNSGRPPHSLGVPLGPEHGSKQQEPGHEFAQSQMQSASVSQEGTYDVHARGHDFRAGTKHKTMLEARTGVGSIKSFPRPGVRSKLVTSTKSTGLQNKTFYCETCGVHVNSDTQLKQHISSRRHKDRAAGKPAKHKYGPYAKTPKGPAKQPIKLSLANELQTAAVTGTGHSRPLGRHGGGGGCRCHRRLRHAPHKQRC
ncbi:unnamed protein product, partial [Tetraodon nigroviridis]